MHKKVKYTLASCLVGISFSGALAWPVQKEIKKNNKTEDTVSVKRDFVGIGPALYELPPEKTKEQLLEEEYEKKHAGADAVMKFLEEQQLISLMQQTGAAAPLSTNALNATFTALDLENSLQQSLQAYLQLDNKEMISNLQNRLGILHVENKAYEKAINSFQRALAIKDELKDADAQIVVCKNLAALYDFLDNAEQAFTYYSLMNRLAVKAKNTYNEAISMEKLAILKARKGQYHDAEQDIIKKVLPLYGRVKSASGRVGAYNSLASIYLAEKKYTQSRWFHLQAVKVASMYGGNHRDMSYSLYSLGKVKKILKEYTLAINDYTSAARYAVQSRDELLSMRIYDDLGDIYIQTKDYAKALSYLQEYDSIKNRLMLVHTDEKTALRLEKDAIIAVLP